MSRPIGVAIVWLVAVTAAHANDDAVLLAKDAIQPQMTISERGIFVAMLQRGNIVVTRSTDGGKTFLKPVTAIDVCGRAKGGMHRGPRIGIDANGVLTVTAPLTFDGAEYKKHYPTAELFFVQSKDGGATWSKPERVNSVAKKAPEALHWMTVSAAGTVSVAWLDMRNRKRGQDIFVATINDGVVSPNVEVAKTVCECCAPGLAIDEEGRSLLAYREGGDAPSREIFAQFADADGRFGKKSRVNEVKTLEDG